MGSRRPERGMVTVPTGRSHPSDTLTRLAQTRWGSVLLPGPICAATTTQLRIRSMFASALSACYACDHNNEFANLPRRDHIIVERGWIAAHVINCALPGWLVLLPLRHVEKLHELSAEEASALGDLRTRLSSASVASALPSQAARDPRKRHKCPILDPQRLQPGVQPSLPEAGLYALLQVVCARIGLISG
jgi:hypothetical protein